MAPSNERSSIEARSHYFKSYLDKTHFIFHSLWHPWQRVVKWIEVLPWIAVCSWLRTLQDLPQRFVGCFLKLGYDIKFVLCGRLVSQSFSYSKWSILEIKLLFFIYFYNLLGYNLINTIYINKVFFKLPFTFVNYENVLYASS